MKKNKVAGRGAGGGSRGGKRPHRYEPGRGWATAQGPPRWGLRRFECSFDSARHAPHTQYESPRSGGPAVLPDRPRGLGEAG